jgi:hypothetical protein
MHGAMCAAGFYSYGRAALEKEIRVGALHFRARGDRHSHGIGKGLKQVPAAPAFAHIASMNLNAPAIHALGGHVLRQKRKVARLRCLDSGPKLDISRAPVSQDAQHPYAPGRANEPGRLLYQELNIVGGVRKHYARIAMTRERSYVAPPERLEIVRGGSPKSDKTGRFRDASRTRALIDEIDHHDRPPVPPCSDPILTD